MSQQNVGSWRQRAGALVARSWDWSRGARLKVSEYIQAWYEFISKEYDAAQATDAVLRDRMRDGAAKRAAAAQEAVTGEEGKLDEAWQQAGVGIGRALRGTVLAIAVFPRIVWLLGLALELLWMFIKLADNVRALRERGVCV